MSAGKHTPGSWQGNLTRAMTREIFAYMWSKDLPVVQVGEDVLAIVWAPDDDKRKGNPSARKNALIMAAAPDLLAACNGMIAWSEGELPDNGPEFSELVNNLRSASAKAEGR